LAKLLNTEPMERLMKRMTIRRERNLFMGPPIFLKKKGHERDKINIGVQGAENK
jgi:hypothetical protein